ncbi:hypothetical protein HXX76_003173 [Chlamydomonas incerta]|uniref:Uncharacterized protein n=1 Tax=Chlamydomonas incerta TaxID=51695 RepID=A0A835W5P5_CHLIN|nr:hypothetical protein HXX76_003173 [Chlamydomonas incerta]|eukprot:KAG2441552.1 hypothetical protein HXX76_003173 [Chlamydomonas incerta]
MSAAPRTRKAWSSNAAAAVLVALIALATAVRAELPNCSPAASSGWGSSYQGRWTLNMPPDVWVDNVGGRPPGPLTVVNDIMYVKVRSHRLPGWGAAGLQVLNISSGTWLGTLWSPNQYRSSTASPDADTPTPGSDGADGASVHYPTPSVPLRVLAADGARNTHLAFFSARAPNGTTLVHAALFGSFEPATGPALTEPRTRINATTGAVIEPPPGRPLLGFAWVRAYGSPGMEDYGMLTDPAVFESLDPQQPAAGGGAAASQPVGFLALTSSRALYVVNASDGSLLYTQEFGGRILRPGPGNFAVPPVNFRGLAVFPTANNSLLAVHLASRTVAWEAAFPASAFSSLQVSSDRLLVRLTKPSSAPGYPYYSVSAAGEVRGFEIDPALSSLSSPRTTNPLSPLTPDGIHFTFMDAAQPNQPQRIGITDLVTLEKRLLTLNATIRYPPVPPAIAYDSCRLVVYGNGYVLDDETLPDVITAVYVIDVATGAGIWRKQLMPVPDGEDSFVQHPHIDPRTGTIYLLQNEMLWRFDAVPEKPELAPPSPAAANFTGAHTYIQARSLSLTSSPDAVTAAPAPAAATAAAAAPCRRFTSTPAPP